jgi:AraC-like DNA-binding protein
MYLTGTSFNDCVEQLCFADAAHLSNEFSRIVGVAPQAYFPGLDKLSQEFIGLI